MCYGPCLWYFHLLFSYLKLNGISFYFHCMYNSEWFWNGMSKIMTLDIMEDLWFFVYPYFHSIFWVLKQ